MNYWLMKSEPDSFSIDDLQNMPGQTEHWDGVRNYQARNLMRDEMKQGDQVFFYHSACKTPGIVGIAEVVREGYPDFTALDPESKYFDPKSSTEHNRWSMVDIRFVKKFPRCISLKELKQHQQLADMALLKKGSRLSIQRVSPEQWQYILTLL